MYLTRKYVQQISLCAVFLLSLLYFGIAGTSPAGVERARNSAIASVLVLEKRILLGAGLARFAIRDLHHAAAASSRLGGAACKVGPSIRPFHS